MKLLPSLATATAALLFAAGTTSAQSAVIGDPASDTTTRVRAGGKFTFELDRQVDRDVAGPTTEKGITVGLYSCAISCPDDLSKDPGKQVFTGPYQPTSHETWKPPYQKFTITIPSNTPKGPAILGVRRVASYGPANTQISLVKYLKIHLNII